MRVALGMMGEKKNREEKKNEGNHKKRTKKVAFVVTIMIVTIEAGR